MSVMTTMHSDGDSSDSGDKDDGDDKSHEVTYDGDDGNNDAMISRLLRRASEEFRIAHRSDPDRPAAAVRGERGVQALARALKRWSRCSQVLPRAAFASRARLTQVSTTGSWPSARTSRAPARASPRLTAGSAATRAT